MADNIAYENTIRGETPLDYQNVSLKQTIVPIADSNNGGYQGNIRFNISSLQNQIVNWSEALLEIPLTFKITGATSNAAVNQYVLGLKNGTIQFIDSMSFKLNNQQLISPQSYSNFYNIYKIMTTWSVDTLNKVGPSVGVAPDNAGSIVWATQGTPTINGDGFSNNVIYPLTAASYAAASPNPEFFNNGLLTRMQNINYYSSAGFGGMTAATPKLTPGITASALVNCNKNNFIVGTGSSTTLGIFNMTISIRLIDLHDLFKKLPFSNYGQIEFTLYYNQFNPTVTTATAPTMVLTTTGQQFGNTCPFMIGSAAASNPGVLLTNTTADVKTFTMTVGNGSAVTGAKPNITQCLLYIPTYDLDPVYLKELYETRPVNEVRYERLLQNNTTGVAPGQSFTFNVTPGQSDLKAIVVIPMYSTSNTSQTFQDFMSPFSSCPGHACPLSSITQFNVTVNNKPVFPANVNYEFDMFLNQVQRINALNSSETDSLNSGLISEYMWTNAYRYYVADLNRQDLDSVSAPKSVNIIGLNNSNVYLDLYCFLVFENKFKLYTATGAIEV